MESVDVASALKKFYFDLAEDPMPEEMDMLLKITEIDRLVYGSDYPYVLAKILLQKKSALDRELLARNLTDKIYVENSLKLF